ncbi:MAG: hypothetical protein NC827_05355 [Candidatus Omnitrophica bacterium]|nr:hypothetical protein [Candidatus Omnitrophota bacterium]
MIFSDINFKFYLKKEGLTSAGIYNEEYHLIKVLWTQEKLKKGWHTVTWNGKDNFGREVEKGEYIFKIVVNNSKYENVGIIGNTGDPPDELNHIQSNVVGFDIDEEGNIYTANDWEEAGHDFKVFNPEGKTIYHARFQMRNLKYYNSMTSAITVDEEYIYCAGWNGWDQGRPGHIVITKFKKGDGRYIGFSDEEIKKNGGVIVLYKWDKRDFPENLNPYEKRLYTVVVCGLTVVDDFLYVTDAFSNKIHIFNKHTGKKIKEFDIKFPVNIRKDKDKRLWIAHEHHKVSIFDKNGNRIATPIEDIDEVRSIFISKENLLYVSDIGKGEVKIYEIDGDKVSYLRSFGQKAKTGDYLPDRFYVLNGAGVDNNGNIITFSGFPTGGARISKFSSEGKCLLDHFSLVFCNIGTYPPWEPKELITTNFHKVLLKNKEKGEWEYRGIVLNPESLKYKGWHIGIPKFIKINNKEFFYFGCRIYRKEGDFFKLVSMVGGPKINLDGSFDKNKRNFGLWTWTDTNLNGEIEEDEIKWFKRSGESMLLTEVYGMHPDNMGNILFGDSAITKSIWELPLAEFDKNGNPIYDWEKAKIIIPEDKSEYKFLPKAVMRNGNGELYALGTSKYIQPPDKGYQWIWMGGWVLSKYDKNGERKWIIPLPNTCTGFDLIPENKGVMIGYFEKGYIYHYTPDGLLIGTIKIGDKAGNITGWLDNQSCISVVRDKRDKKLDVFVEDSYLNRFIWYRVDDSDIKTYEKTIIKE